MEAKSSPEPHSPSLPTFGKQVEPRTMRTLPWTCLVILGLVFALTISFIKAVAAAGGRPTNAFEWGELMGATISPLILGLLIALTYYALRKGRRTRRRVVNAIVIWTLVLSFVPRDSTAPRWPSTDQETGTLMAQAYKEASGAIPPERYSKDDIAVAMREIFQDFIQFRQQYEQEMGQLDTAEMRNLYGLSSFENRMTIEETRRQLLNAANMDSNYSSLEPIFAKAESQISRKEWPENVKRNFLKGMQESLTEADANRAAEFRLEQSWIDASVDLYTYVLDNFPAFAVRDNRLVVKDENTLQAFNQKLEHAVQLHRQVLQSVAAFDGQQAEKLGKYGLTPAELGAGTP